VYVLPEWRRQGVFKALYRHVENLARQDPHVCGLRLYVERENFKAQLAYQSLGMQLAPYLMIETEFHHN
jgi:ribosomal protein S18 acetylase RimI-like enzyme